MVPALSSTPFTTLTLAAFAPMPSARVTTAAMAKTMFRRNDRIATRNSCQDIRQGLRRHQEEHRADAFDISR